MAIQLSDFVLTPGIIDGTSLSLSWVYGSINSTPITYNQVQYMTIYVNEKSLSTGLQTVRQISATRSDINDTGLTIYSVNTSSVYTFSATIVVSGTTYSSMVSVKITPIPPLDVFTLDDIPGTNEEENSWYSIYLKFTSGSTNPNKYTVGIIYTLHLTLFSTNNSDTNSTMTPIEVTIPITQVQGGLAPFTTAELAGTDNYEYILKYLDPTLKYHVAAKLSQVVTQFGNSYTISSPLSNTIIFSTSLLPDSPDVSITGYNTDTGVVTISATLSNTGIANGKLGMRLYYITGTTEPVYTLLKDTNYDSISASNPFTPQVVTYNTNTTTFNNGFTFTLGQPHKIVVVAYNASGDNNTIEETPRTSRNMSFITAIKPSAPTLTVVSANSTSVNLSWTTNIYTGIMSNFFNKYEITYIDVDDSNRSYTEAVGGSTMSTNTYTLTVPTAAREHKVNYSVKAVLNGPDTLNQYKASGLTINATISGDSSINSAFATTYSIPQIPNNFSISYTPGECNLQAKLLWSIPSNSKATTTFPSPQNYISNGLPIKKYKIYSVDSVSGSIYTFVTSVDEADLSSYTKIISGLTNGQPYHYAITTETSTSGASSFAEILVESAYSATKSIIPFNIPAAPTVSVHSFGNHYVQLAFTDNSIISDGVSRSDTDVFFKPTFLNGGSTVTISPLSYAKSIQYPYVVNLPNTLLNLTAKGNYKNPNNASTFDTSASSPSVQVTPTFSQTRFNVSGVSLSETGIAISNAGATVTWSKPILSGTDWTNSDLAFKNYNISLFDTTNPGTAAKTHNIITNIDTLTHTFTGLTNGTNYYAKISVTYDDTETLTQRTTDAVQSSNNLRPITYPAAPTNIVNDTFVDKQITVRWTAPTDLGGASSVTNYTVSIHDNTIPATPVIVGSPYTTTTNIANHTFTGLTNNTPYIVKVLTNTTNPNNSQNIQSLLPLVSGNLKSFQPNIPSTTGLAATAGDTLVNLIWNATPADGLPVTYTIYYSNQTINAGNYLSGTKIDNITTNSKIINSLVNGTTYYFIVIATINNPNIGYTTLKYSSDIGSVVSAVPLKSTVTAPTNFKGKVNVQAAGSSTTSGSVTLDFSQSSQINDRVDGNQISGFNLYRDGVKINSAKITTTTYTDTGRTLGTTYVYYYTYVAFDPNDTSGNPTQLESGASPTVSLIPFATPTVASNIKYSTINQSGKLTVTWEAPISPGGLDIKYKIVCTNTINSGNSPTTENASYQNISGTTASFTSLTLGDIHSVVITAFIVPSTLYGQSFTQAEKENVATAIEAIPYDPNPNAPAFLSSNTFTNVTESGFTTNITYSEKLNTGLITSNGRFMYTYTDTYKTPNIIVSQLGPLGALGATASDTFSVPTQPINTTGDYWNVTAVSRYDNPNYSSYKSNFYPEASQYISSANAGPLQIAPFGPPSVMFSVIAQNQSAEANINNTVLASGNFEYYTIRVTDDAEMPNDVTGISIFYNGVTTNSNTTNIYTRDATNIGINGLINGTTYRVYMTVTVNNPLDPDPVQQASMSTSSSTLSFFRTTPVASSVPSIVTTRTPSTSISSISGDGTNQTITFNSNNRNFRLLGYKMFIKASDNKVYHFYGNANNNSASYAMTTFPIQASTIASTIQVKIGQKIGGLTVLSHAITTFNEHGASETFFYDNGVTGNSFNST